MYEVNIVCKQMMRDTYFYSVRIHVDDMTTCILFNLDIGEKWYPSFHAQYMTIYISVR